MSIERMEERLRRAPTPKAPEDLLRKLTADIRLPRAAMNPAASWSGPPSWARRWMPALSFAAILLICVVAIAVQTNMLAELQRENGGLRAAKGNLETLCVENAEYQKLVAESQEAERLRKDNAELLKLRGEVGQLRAQLQDAGKLRAENRQLLAKASQAGGAAGTNADFFSEAQAKAERVHCMNNMKQIGLACRLWADDNNSVGPTNFICMTNELSTWQILQCPSDKSHNVTNWAEVAAGNISYILDTPGISQSEDPRTVMVECPIHHNIGLLDGSVHQLTDEQYSRLKIVEGKKVFAP